MNRIVNTCLTACLVLSLGCGEPSGFEDVIQTKTESLTPAITSTVAFNQLDSDGGAALESWSNQFVMSEVNGVTVYPKDPAVYFSGTGEAGFIRNLPGDIIFSSPIGDTFSALPLGGRSVWRAVAEGGGKLFALSSKKELLRFDQLGGPPISIGTTQAHRIVADDEYLYTLKATNDTYDIERQRFDGTQIESIGTFVDRPSWLAIEAEWLAQEGYFYAIPRTSASVLGFSKGQSFTVSIAKPDGASLAAAAGNVFVAASSGIWQSVVGSSNATLIRSPQQIHLDANAGASVSCGLRHEYGKGSAFTADGEGIYVVCKSLNSNSQQVLLSYSHSGQLKRRLYLTKEFLPLGKLRSSATHLCALQEKGYHRSPRFPQLRCFAK